MDFIIDAVNEYKNQDITDEEAGILYDNIIANHYDKMDDLDEFFGADGEIRPPIDENLPIYDPKVIQNPNYVKSVEPDEEIKESVLVDDNIIHNGKPINYAHDLRHIDDAPLEIDEVMAIPYKEPEDYDSTFSLADQPPQDYDSTFSLALNTYEPSQNEHSYLRELRDFFEEHADLITGVAAGVAGIGGAVGLENKLRKKRKI